MGFKKPKISIRRSSWYRIGRGSCCWWRFGGRRRSGGWWLRGIAIDEVANVESVFRNCRKGNCKTRQKYEGCFHVAIAKWSNIWSIWILFVAFKIMNVRMIRSFSNSCSLWWIQSIYLAVSNEFHQKWPWFVCFLIKIVLKSNRWPVWVPIWRHLLEMHSRSRLFLRICSKILENCNSSFYNFGKLSIR